MRLITIFLTLGICSCTVSVPSIESRYVTKEELASQLNQFAQGFNALSGKVHALEQAKEQGEQNLSSSDKPRR